jgi:myelin regulatory factor
LLHLLAQIDSTTQLQNISKLKVYSYQYTDEFADYANLPSYARGDSGVLAQELRDILPDAVVPTGNVTLGNGEVVEDLLVVNKVT